MTNFYYGSDNDYQKAPVVRFIDLFAGIGGTRMGFESGARAANAYAQCVFTSEVNRFSKRTYIENFGNHHPFIDDIVPFPAEDIPDHDVLLAGFPFCHLSTSRVDLSKSAALTSMRFFDVARIISAKRPKVFLLESVKNLMQYNRGNTFRILSQTLRDELGYNVHCQIVDSHHFVPQHRPRCFIIGFRENKNFSWDKLHLPSKEPRLASILHRINGAEPELPWDGDKYFNCIFQTVQPKYTLSDKMWVYLQEYAMRHRTDGHGAGFGLVTPDRVARALSTRYYKDGSEILIVQSDGYPPRRLTPRECARLMGFPDTFIISVSDTQAYRQFGNSTVVPIVREITRLMLTSLSDV